MMDLTFQETNNLIREQSWFFYEQVMFGDFKYELSSLILKKSML